MYGILQKEKKLMINLKQFCKNAESALMTIRSCLLPMPGRCTAVLQFLLISFIFLLPLAASAQNHEKTVRAGWHEPPYFMLDKYGRRFGYSYEYQQKLSAYTGWKFDYVEGNWSELLEMLKKGEIDILANVSYTDERAKNYLYASLPMGTEVYYLFISPNNTSITSDNYFSLNGKTVGLTKDSIQSGLFRQWSKIRNIKPEILELTSTEEESLQMLGSRLDAFVTMDVNIAPNKAVPVWKIGSSDYFFALSSHRSDLLPLLNSAMSKIQDENISYNQQLGEKYFKNQKANLFLNAEEKKWLSKHGKIRIGYQDNYLAFCARDEVTGELKGALRDYLDYASGAFENASLDFEMIAYPTASAALQALQKGEIDCMFPVNLIPSDAESMDVIITPALMKTEMDAVVRKSDEREFIRRDKVTVAVNQGNINYEMFLRDNFPNWQIKLFPNTTSGLEAIAAGEADSVIISNYRFNNIAKQCKKLNLTTVYTGVDLDYYLAVRRGDTELYSILAKTTAIVPDSTIHAALTYYSTEDAKHSFLDIIKANLVTVILAVIIVILLILLLLLKSIKAERKITDGQRRINDLSTKVFVDALTHVRNKAGFDEFIHQLQSRLDNGENIDLAIGVFDCDKLKKINDMHGHDKGNLYLQASSSMICHVFKHSPVFRIGGDEFVVVFRDGDYQIRDTLLHQFEEQQNLTAESKNEWEKISISCGIAVYDPEIDTSLKDLFRRADALMYENKTSRNRNRKS